MDRSIKGTFGAFRSLSQHIAFQFNGSAAFTKVKNSILKFGHSVVALAALRGGVVVTMAILANILHVREMGQLSAVYSVVVAGAQIIGYALNVLALDLAKDATADADGESRMALSCSISWLIISLFIICSGLFAQSAIRSLLFSNIITPTLFTIGLFWLCGIAFEMMAVAAAVGRQKMPIMAAAGALQCTLMITLTPVIVWKFGEIGMAAIAAISMTSGLLVFGAMKPWKSLHQISDLLKEIHLKIPKVIGPSILAALFLTALNVLLIYQISRISDPFFQLAVFSVCLQIISIFSFFPQVLYNITISNFYRPGYSKDARFSILINGSLVSLLFCGLLALSIDIFSTKILTLYGSQYIGAVDAVALIGLILIAQGPLQILTQHYVAEEKQWELAAFCAASTALGYTFFLWQPDPSASAMLKALLVANFSRGLMVMVSLFLARQHIAR